MALVFAASICFAAEAGDFAGTWYFKSDGLAFFKLTLVANGAQLTGSLTKPRDLRIGQDGAVTRTGGAEITLPIQKAAKPSRLELTIDDDDFVVSANKDGSILMRMEGMRPWRLERGLADLRLTTSLSEEHYPADIVSLRAKLRGMIDQDQSARLPYDDKRADDIDARNGPVLLTIFNRYGWVTNSLAGKDAAHDFWLLVQHQPLHIQQRMLPSLKAAADRGDASEVDYAYLCDRVQMAPGEPQHWGYAGEVRTGKPVLYAVDDLAGLDGRRKQLFMLPSGEETDSSFA